MVDDAIWEAADSMCSGISSEMIGYDRIFAACEPMPAHFEVLELAPGMPTVKMQAFLSGTRVVLETAPQPVNPGCGFVQSSIHTMWRCFGMDK